MRYLTKSKFNLALDCPTKLFYTGKPQYVNASVGDSFLRSLADGGFQVGKLAQCYHPEGILIETPNDEVAWALTAEYLERGDVTLFEAVFRHGNFLVRADIVVKTGNRLDLYEVKAKSCGFADESEMWTKKGGIDSKWTQYVADVAFQKHVIALARPDLEVVPHLMLVDKTAAGPTDGLNQKFRLKRDGDRRRVEVEPAPTVEDLSPQMLRAINVEESCRKFFATTFGTHTFDSYVNLLADHYVADIKLVTEPNSGCKDCEYRLAEHEHPNKALFSGFKECWSDSLGWTDEDFDAPTVLDLWDFKKKDKFMAERKIKLVDLVEEDIAPAPDGKPGLHRTQRQWMQVDFAQRGVTEPYIDRTNLAAHIESWQYPLHFIDFETSSPVIPFKRGRRPYEGVLFQFSHHTVDAAGNIAHAGEFLYCEPGSFPNYDCVRELMNQLSGDNGTIFRYAAHENSYLCAVREQLIRDQSDIPDRDELIRFIESITNPRKDDADPWTPNRPMVDLLDLVKRHHYDPATNGSNSLKYVLPATLNSSAHLQAKYAAPIYGAADGIPSRNFRDHTWIARDTRGRVIDPYKLLPVIFSDETASDYAAIVEQDKLKDGGAAMTAYCKLQFEDLPDDARDQIKSALLKYCELDTLAMVMIYEAWRSEF